MPRDISIVLKGNYTDRDVKRAIRDLQTLQTQGAKTAAAAGPVSRSLGGIAGSWKSLIAGGLAGLGAGMLVGQLKDMATTAIEDQESVEKLAVALRNMGQATAQSGVEDFIKKTMMATGVMDDDLRPAMARLLRSTDDVAESQRAMGLALDISAATGKDLGTVANGLGKAYDGNAASLGRLGLGIDKAVLASGDMAEITGIIQQKFGGSAAAAAGTYAGQLARMSAAVDEAKEAIGYGLLGAVNDITAAFGGTGGATDAVGAFGDEVGNSLRGAGDWVATLVKSLNGGGGPSLTDALGGVVKAIPFVGQSIEWAADRGADLKDSEEALNTEVNKAITLRQMYAIGSTAAGNADEYATNKAKELNAEITHMNRGLTHQSARASVEAAIDAFSAADVTSTTSKTWKDKHGKSHTSSSKSVKEFMTDWKGGGFDLGTAAGRQGLDMAEALIKATQSEALLEKNPANAVKTYAYGRKNLIEQLRGIGVDASDARRYARENLATPVSTATEAKINSDNRTTITVVAPNVYTKQEIAAMVLAVWQKNNTTTGIPRSADSTTDRFSPGLIQRDSAGDSGASWLMGR